jgi:hypothetical protein
MEESRMDSYTVEKVPDAPAILVVVRQNWSTATDAPAVLSKVEAMLDASDEPLYYMSDVREAPFNIADIIQIANIVKQARRVLQHPNLKGIIAISPLKLIELAAKGMSSDAFGNIDVRVLETVEEALDYARTP